MNNKFLALCTQDWFNNNWFVKGKNYWCWVDNNTGPEGYINIQTKLFDRNNLPIVAFQKIENWQKHFVKIDEWREQQIKSVLDD